MELHNEATRLDYNLTEYSKDGATILIGMAPDKRHTEIWCLPKLNLNNPTKSHYLAQTTIDHVMNIRENGGIVFVARTPYDIELQDFLIRFGKTKDRWRKHYCASNKIKYQPGLSNYDFISMQYWEHTKHLYESLDMALEYKYSVVHELLSTVLIGSTHLIEDIFKTTYHNGKVIHKLYQIFLENKPLILPFLRKG